jgi:hypothetical protein
LQRLAEHPVTAKQVERLSRAIGGERMAQREAATAAFQALPLAQKFAAPPEVAGPELAVVMVDGGRLQIRERTPPRAAAAATTATGDEAWDEEEPHKGFWREDKVGVLLTMQAATHAADPCPVIPPGFLDVVRIPQLVREIGKLARQQADDPAVPEAEEPLASPSLPVAYEPPAVVRRQVLASCQPWPKFAVTVAAAAWQAGWQKAGKKAFVADGAANNWRLQRRFFGSFVPVLDFIHALSYVFAAALAGQSGARGWECYREWIGWIWQGQVSRVIAALQERQQEIGEPTETDGETSPRQVVAGALGYLRNHQDKMKYDQYRAAGLPLTSSVMESVVKQMNRRVKGTEKFWCQQGAEGIVQLRADHLGDDAPMDTFWQQRQAQATGLRRYQRAA